MTRLVLYVLYDIEGIVDEYVLFNIRALSNVADRLIVIINGEISNDGLLQLESFTKDVFRRKNIGYDGGAYKDVFMRYLKTSILSEFDEIIMMNDTFYGPFYPWKDVFSVMNKEHVDFWGLSDSKKLITPDGEVITPHIHGFFIACRKKLFLSECFMEFWRKMEYPKNHQDAVMNFEVKFTHYFENEGFCRNSLSNILGYKNSEDNACIDIMDKGFEMILCGIPILKRKSVLIPRYYNARKALQYIKENTSYDIDMIWNNIKRYEKNSIEIPFRFSEIMTFAKTHGRLFVFGRGRYGKSVVAFLEDQGVTIEKYIVSNIYDEMQDTIGLKDYNYHIGDGIIVALSSKYKEQFWSNIYKYFPNEALLMCSELL